MKKKPSSYWKTQLTSEQYRVCREKGTEPAFSGEYYHNEEAGVYHCVCCGQPLFNSENKYDSGSGWPSFFQVIDETSIETATDLSHLMIRTEIKCARCDAHLGHVFDDGPAPTHKRYCVNSVCLEFKKKS